MFHHFVFCAFLKGLWAEASQTLILTLYLESPEPFSQASLKFLSYYVNTAEIPQHADAQQSRYGKPNLRESLSPCAWSYCCHIAKF